jgi:hypothetical protein
MPGAVEHSEFVAWTEPENLDCMTPLALRQFECVVPALLRRDEESVHGGS